MEQFAQIYFHHGHFSVKKTSHVINSKKIKNFKKNFLSDMLHIYVDISVSVEIMVRNTSPVEKYKFMLKMNEYLFNYKNLRQQYQVSYVVR